MDKSDPSLQLIVASFVVYIAQYAANLHIPSTVFQSSMPFMSLTRSLEETTLLYCTTGNDETPAAKLESLNLPRPRHHDGPYALLRVQGPLNLALTGILNEITTPLKEAKVPIYAVSTWNTDYVLIPADKKGDAVAALQASGWRFSA